VEQNPGADATQMRPSGSWLPYRRARGDRKMDYVGILVDDIHTVVDVEEIPAKRPLLCRLFL
jgi:hypothetical protein